MWRSTFVPETIFRRCIRLKQTERTCWTIQTHSDELNWARCGTFHELNSLSRGLAIVRANQKFDVWPRPRQFRDSSAILFEPPKQLSLVPRFSNGSITCKKAALLTSFWRHRFNITKILSKFGKQQLVMVNYACGFNQSETGKYFEWIIRYLIIHDKLSHLGIPQRTNASV